MTCHPLESNQNLPGFSRARRPSTQEWHRETWAHVSLVVDIWLSRPVRTVSLAFHCERLLGEPSIHLCCSRLQFGLRGSNSHFQSQSLAFCRLNEARSLVSLPKRRKPAEVLPQAGSQIALAVYQSAIAMRWEPSRGSAGGACYLRSSRIAKRRSGTRRRPYIYRRYDRR